MELHYLVDNLTNPALLFFFLGLIAVNLKSDLKIPENSSKFISLYLLLAIGFKGGQELSHSIITSEIIWSLLFGVLLIAIYSKEKKNKTSFKSVIHHSLTNGSVVLIIGSLLVGYLTNDAQAEGIKPFTTDIFKGFLAVLLLDMGITSGGKLKALIKKGWFTLSFSIVIPIINGCLVAIISGLFMEGR